MNARTLPPGAFTALWLLPIMALLQASFADQLAIRGVMPGLLLIVVVNWGILRGMDQGMLWAFIGGLLLDVFSGWPVGTNTVALVVVASLVSLGEGTFIRTHALLPPVTVFAATVLYYLIVFFILESTQHPIDWAPGIRSIALPAAFYNAVLTLVAFPLVRRLEERVYPVPRASW
jgi:rod shape-determining protein MreD